MPGVAYAFNNVPLFIVGHCKALHWEVPKTSQE
jgi:hypothetical protein